MKKNNIHINKDLLARIIIIGLSIGGTSCYYLYDDQKQVIESQDNLDIFTDENGQICCNFDVGEHKIMISRNDGYYHKYNSIDGYMIQDVTIAGWRDNSKVTYVNTEPVTAVAKVDKNGKLIFNDFGVVKSKQKVNK